MKKNARVLAGYLLMLLSVLAVCFGQDQYSDSKQKAGDDQEGRISLRSQLEKCLAEQKNGKENSILVRKLRRELAKRGDTNERAKIIAALGDKSPTTQLMAIQDAENVGGRDMIVALATLLSDDTGYRSASSQSSGPKGERIQGDVVFEPVSVVAAKAMAQLIEAPPVPPIGKNKTTYTKKDVDEWRKWWAKNKGRYMAEKEDKNHVTP